MDEHIYKLIELTGTSGTSMEDAVNRALSRAGQTVRNMKWFEVISTRGVIDAGRVSQWQVTLRVGFALDES